MTQPDEQVWMTHPDTKGAAQVTREAFDALWSEKGWTLADSHTVAAVVVTDGAVSDLSRLKVDELVELVAGRPDLVLPEKYTKADLVALLESAATPA
jgi:hypothetical protein